MIKLLAPFFLIAIFWIFWLPGNRVASDFHIASKSVQLGYLTPQIWKEIGVADGLGEYTASSLWAQPLHSFFGVLSLIGLSFEVQTKLLGLIIIMLGFWGMWKLLGEFKLNLYAKSVGSLFFILNSYFLLLFDGGQLSLSLAYAVIPLVWTSFLKTINTYTLFNLSKFIFGIALVSVFDLRIVYLVFFLISTYLFFKILIGEEIKATFRKVLTIFFVSLIFLVGIHAYWLLPSFFSKPIQLPTTYDRSSQVDFLSFATIGHSLLLQQPHWYENIFGKVASLKLEFIFIPFLILLALLKKKDFLVGFWALMALVGAFLAKGSNPPLPDLYSFLFVNIPGFSLFRDPSKFFFFVVISYSVLIAVVSDQFFKKFPKASFLVLIYIIFLARPVYLGQMTGLLSFPSFEKEYSNLASLLKEDDSFGRVFWIPTKPPLSFENEMHPGVEAARLAQKRPFAVGVKGTYETLNFLREAPFMGEIFNVAGIKYIAYPYLDFKRQQLDLDKVEYYQIFLNQLSKLSWIKNIDLTYVPLLETYNHQDKFFILSDLWWVIGSDDLYNESTKSASLSLSKNGLTFIEEHSNLGQLLDNYPDAKIVLNKKTEIDLAASLIPYDKLIFPAKKLGFSPGENNWWKREAADLINWREFLQTKYGFDNQDFDLGGGWAVAEGNLKLTTESQNLGRGRVLLARVLESTKSGSIKFYQGGQMINQIITKIEGGSNIRWFEVGEFENNGSITIETEGGINVVNALSVIEKKQWEQYKNRSAGYVKDNRVYKYKEDNTSDISATISFREINSAKYEVTLKNLKKPTYIIFSQNYDKLWKLENQNAVPVYSLLNGFRIEKDGTYIVEFDSQKYLNLGIKISLIFLFAAIIIVILLTPRRGI